MELIQGTPEWVAWRRGKIGSSDVGAILLESEYSTPYEVWKNKTGRAQEKESNWAMTRGSEWEDRVRALYELTHDVDLPPAILQHPDLPWAAVSLDGYSEEQGLVLEIKYPGQEKHEQAKIGKVPRCYIGQVQYQLFVSGAKRAHYASFNGENLAVVEVLPDYAYWERMLKELTAFWKLVETDTPPPLTDRDYLETSDPKWIELCERWKQAKWKESKPELEGIRREILAQMPHPKILCSGVKIITVNRKTGKTLDIRG